MNVPLPPPLHGPRFSSYDAAEVSWLLTDLSHVALEAPAEEREAMMQAKAGHYAESLPVEYQPTGEYLELFHQALAASAARVAHAVGVVTELVVAARRAPVLVSLARAGTPVGILMRRWAQFAHGVDLPHYAVSIVRGRGIDAEAMRHLARHHKELTRTYGPDGSFVLLLKVINSRAYGPDVVELVADVTQAARTAPAAAPAAT